MSRSSQQVVENAAGPFDKRCNADVLFLTADNVNFYLHKNVLSLASTFFEGMFSLSQPAVTEMYAYDDLPIVEVPEDSLTLDNLLRYCYPVQEPAISDLQVLDRVLGAALRYSRPPSHASYVHCEDLSTHNRLECMQLRTTTDARRKRVWQPRHGRQPGQIGPSMWRSSQIPAPRCAMGQKLAAFQPVPTSVSSDSYPAKRSRT